MSNETKSEILERAQEHERRGHAAIYGSIQRHRVARAYERSPEFQAMLARLIKRRPA